MAKPIDFPQKNFTFTVPKGCESIMQPLPCWVDNTATVSCWELSDEEINWIVKNRKIWLKQMNQRQPLQPQLVIANDVEFPTPFGFCELIYHNEILNKNVSVYNSTNLDVPTHLTIEGGVYSLSNKYKPVFNPHRGSNLKPGAYYLRLPTPDEATIRRDWSLKEFRRLQEAPNSGITEEIANEFLDKLNENSLQIPVLIRVEPDGLETFIG